MRRIGVAIVLFFLFVFFVGWLGAAIGGGWFGHEGERARFFPFFPLLLVALVVGFVAFGRAVRRTARPIGEVMEAAARIADGDLSARAPVHGPPDVRQLASAFNRMAERIEADERQRRDLLADVTHELRTPLSVIRARVEGMRDGLYEADGEHLALIERETEVMARLLDDLQLLSNAEAGALTLHRERAEARALIGSAATAFAQQAGRAGVSLGTDVTDDLPPLEVDRVRIGEVLSNLVSNALRHTPPGGTITLRAERRGGNVAFAVADTGEGIAEDELPHVFDRFARSAASRGAGLGLAIAKSLVEAHGGSIRADSRPGSGTTITFELPAPG
jgi:two-component system sensor histidine kinase BaeS